MDAVGVVPEDAEVGGGGLQCGKGAHGLVAVGDAGGVGVHGDAPDALDGGIVLDKVAHDVHIGAVGSHGNGDVLDAVVGGHGKVAVVAGRRAQELDLVELAPGGVASDAVGVGVSHGVVHEVKARRANDQHVCRIDAQKLGRKGAGRGQAVRRAVVVGRHAAVRQVARGIKLVEHGLREVDLLLAGLAASHIQGQALGLEIGRLDL